MNISLRTKMIVMNSAVVLPLLIILNIAVMNAFVKYTLGNVKSTILNHSYTVQLQVNRYLSERENILGRELFFLSDDLRHRIGARTQLYYADETQTILVDSGRQSIEYGYIIAEDEGLLLGLRQQKNYLITDVDGVRSLVMNFPLYLRDQPTGAARIIYPLEKEYALIRALARIIIGVSGAVFLAMFIFLLPMTRWIVSPLIQLRNRMTEFRVDGADQEDNPPMESAFPDEVDELSRSYGLMVANIRELFTRLRDEKQKQKHFFDHMTHELKTPLTAILGYADLAKKNLSEDKKEQCLAAISREASRLLNQVNHLLDQSKLSQYEIEVNPRWTNITKLLKEESQRLQARAKNQQMDIRIFSPIDYMVFVDPDRVSEIVLNLVDNAIKHSETKVIDVSACITQENWMVLSVRDYGRGMSYRPQNDRDEKDLLPLLHSSGSGLGLQICRKIAEAHGGRLDIVRHFVGTEVRVYFPIKKLNVATVAMGSEDVSSRDLV